MKINAINKGITPKTDITLALSELLKECSKISEPKTIIIEPGDYYIDSNSCNREILYITNSCGDKEYNIDNEIPRLCNIAVHIKNINDLEIIAHGVNFIVDGRVTNIVIDCCSNIKIEGLDIDVINPDMHTLKVIKKGLFYVDYELNNESIYLKEDNKFYFAGKDYKYTFTDTAVTAHWIGLIPPDNINTLIQVRHPLSFAMKIKELAPYKFRIYYPFCKNQKVGNIFNLFDVKRKNAGIIINKSSNVSLIAVKQHFNYGLAFVAQDSDTLTIDSCEFAPKKDSSRYMSSVADFMQICMCKGDVKVTNCTFIGAGDDMLNVHGIHFKVVDIKDNYVEVKFCHWQTLGFNPLHIGDTVEFIDRFDLDVYGKATILESELVDNYTIKLKLDHTDGLKNDMVLEDVSRCPNLYYINNFMTRIITRGILATTRGKIVIDHNIFDNTSAHSILVSNDAKSWYESGRVEDLTVTNNTFNRCPMYTVQILPENAESTVKVHKNITIEGNIVNSEKGGFYIKNADNVVIKNNNFTKHKGSYELINSNVQIDK